MKWDIDRLRKAWGDFNGKISMSHFSDAALGVNHWISVYIDCIILYYYGWLKGERFQYNCAHELMFLKYILLNFDL